MSLLPGFAEKIEVDGAIVDFFTYKKEKTSLP